MARTVRTLISKGVLVKLGTIGRGRAEQLELTPLGRTILADDPLQSISAALEVLPQKDREALANGLEIAIRATMPEPATLEDVVEEEDEEVAAEPS